MIYHAYTYKICQFYILNFLMDLHFCIFKFFNENVSSITEGREILENLSISFFFLPERKKNIVKKYTN